MADQNVVEVIDLRKSYGGRVVVNGVSFAVAPGEVFGLLGPNGAGKTTTVECIEGLRRPDAGRIRVLGLDPLTNARLLQPRLGVQLQEAALPERITVAEAMDLFAGLYARRLPGPQLLEQVGLAEKRRSRFGSLSGGQKQRLFVALALLHDPDVVFLDELTTGLDPHARRGMWELVRSVQARGKTLLLTTHLMEEAEHLCDRVAILAQGRIVALDTPAGLVRTTCGTERVMFTAAPGFRPDLLAALPEVHMVECAGERVTVHAAGGNLTAAVLRALADADVSYHDLRVEQPTLEDAYLALTRRRMDAAPWPQSVA